jgi:hypothetical protein
MNEERDLLLERLISTSQVGTDGEVFTAAVMERADRLRRRWLVVTIVLSIAAGFGVAFSVAPLADVVLQLLLQPLVRFDAGLAMPILGPVNSIAGASVLALLAVHRLCRWADA